MKNKLKIAVLFMLCALLLVACGVPGGGEACQHRDADDNALCDKCSVSYTDGKDIPDAPVCQHRDANDDGKCDECAEPYTDGKDIPDAPACQHRDANDDDKCDECAEPYTDGKDIPDLPEENHVDTDLDHACDCGCGTRFGTHWDTDKNHVCDYGCKELLFVHDDLDKDHACDYCAGNIGECLDADKNHACDYGCAKTFGMHLDENLDHICDYGCTLTFGAHLDENKDHKCDYGCAEVIGEHNANTLDGTCDYCGEIFAHDCVDTDKTHLCDICGAAIGECADVNADHLCDYCTKQLTDCEDANKNHACDICGAAMGVCMDANKDHLCDYGCCQTFGVHEDSNCDHYCEYCACYDFDFGAHEDRDFNHYCDYGCSELIGVCKDSDFDHKCDYGCEYYYGEHADTDKNGTCDYCNETIDHECVDEDLNHWCDYGCTDSYFGECTDKDQDSKCDYGCGRHYCWDQDEDSYCDFGCGRHFCYDNDRDHFCDFNCGNSWAWEEHHPGEENHFCLYCGERLTECYDFDPLDHNCDLCGMWVGECVDEYPADHICDICRLWLGECVDEYPTDHFCDVCGERLTECLDEYPADHICDICGERLTECLDESPTDHICDICSTRLSECLDEYPVDHKCDLCGDVLSICEDTDFDHKCDLFCEDYGKFYASHVDENKDHICDAYGEKCLQGVIGVCEDADKNGFCDHGCGKQFEIEADAPLYTRDGDYIYFGEYPQTIKADNVTITETQDSRGYFLGSDGCYYAMVTAKLASYGYTFSSGAEVVHAEIYYFKVEPIRWKILSLENGVAFILCENIIANMFFDEYNGAESNNYKDSDIRAWLNKQFYETAFSTLQRDLILTTLVDNSLASTGYKDNPYTCENTEDKIFLLSYADMTNNGYGFNTVSYAADAMRRRMTTDYVRASGGWMSTESKYYGYGKWWLRTPYYNYKRLARCILQNGEIFDDNYIYLSNIGVAPALRIQLALHEEHYDNDYDRHCDECAMTMCAHTDENSDHFCDVNGIDCIYGSIGDCKDVNKDGYCDYGCGKTFEIIPDPLYVRDGDYIYFGEYPQTIKADDVTITETQDSRGYFLGSDGCYYAKVLAQTASGPSFKFSTGATISRYTTYYFKVEPIRWRILSESNGMVFVLCDSIIASSAYQSSGYQNGNKWYTNANGAPVDTYVNNYQYSGIRAWLNAQFYETAFGDLQQALIQTTLVDNSAASTTSATNSYVCENTQDKIFLLSYKEAMNSAYGMGSKEARQMITSDYGRATGVYMATDSSYYGNGNWWLRSPRDNASNQACTVSTDGYTDQIVAVSNPNYGIVPALWIRL